MRYPKRVRFFSRRSYTPIIKRLFSATLTELSSQMLKRNLLVALISFKEARMFAIFTRSLGCTLVEMLTTQPPHADFWHKHKERAQFLFLEQARPEATNQLQYIGHQLVPHASSAVQVGFNKQPRDDTLVE